MPLEFSVAVEQWVQAAKARSDLAFPAIALDAVNHVKSLTPVNTGYLRANWTIVRNNDPIPLPGRVPRPEEVIEHIRVGDRILIVNPVIYARQIEFGFVGQDSLGRNFDQPGRGMAQQTMAAMPEIARRAVQRVMADQGQGGGTR